MKKNYKYNLTFIGAIVLMLIITSCSKDNNTAMATNQVSKSNQVGLSKSWVLSNQSSSGCNGTIEQILTQKVWKSNEVRTQLSNNTTQYYLRGGTSNTVNYDSDSLKFNSNNTGIYYYLGSQYSTTWNFTDALKTKLTLVVNFGSPTTLYWENVNVCNSTYLRYTQYTTTGITYMSSILRVPN